MIDSKHPRAKSLHIRERVVAGVKKGITSLNGLIAQGRGEAFDYLLREKTQPFASEAIKAAAAQLLLAKYPVVSVNGNTAALVPEDLITLARLLNCPLEINLFHRSRERLEKIKEYLLQLGAKKILISEEKTISEIASPRKFANAVGIAKADVVLVPLEDGDRAEALIRAGKIVITIDLNPLSRTAQTASLTIVDNIVRALPELTQQIKKYKNKRLELEVILKQYDNQKILNEAIKKIRQIP